MEAARMTATDVDLESGWHTEFTTGLIDKYDFTITSSIFTKDSRYNKGDSLLLAWTGATNVDDYPERSVFITIGNGWTTEDGGRTIVREDPNTDKKFNKSTKMAFLIDRCINVFQIAEVLKPRGPVFQSDIWEGLSFRMERQILDATNTDAKPSEFPAAFLGVQGGSTPTPSSNGAATSNGNALSSRDQVKALFKASADYASAQPVALAIPGVSTDAALLQEVLDPSKLWAEANA